VTDITLFEILTLGGGLIGVYVKLSTDLGKLKSRVIMLERRDDEVKQMLTGLVEAVQEIKLLLATKGMR
tara:strand:- start:200 stop:406 length:207 start_codon:yes stop_codon:yes gene_type:complete